MIGQTIFRYKILEKFRQKDGGQPGEDGIGVVTKVSNFLGTLLNEWLEF